MKEDEERDNWEEDETDELIIEDLTEIQGGIGIGTSGTCDLGCFVGEGFGK